MDVRGAKMEMYLLKILNEQEPLETQLMNLINLEKILRADQL